MDSIRQGARLMWQGTKQIASGDAPPAAPRDTTAPHIAEKALDHVLEAETMLIGIRGAMQLGLLGAVGVLGGPPGMAAALALGVGGILVGKLASKINLKTINTWGQEIGDRHFNGDAQAGRTLTKLSLLLGQTAYLVTGDATSSALLALCGGGGTIGATRAIHWLTRR